MPRFSGALFFTLLKPYWKRFHECQDQRSDLRAPVWTNTKAKPLARFRKSAGGEPLRIAGKAAQSEIGAGDPEVE